MTTAPSIMTTTTATTITATTSMDEWDLTSSISPFLDRHMMFPLLEYLDSLINAGSYTNYETKDVAAARLSLLGPTHMVDYAIDIYKELHGTVPAEMEEQKKQVLADLEALQGKCQALRDLCENAEQRSKLTSSGQWNVPGLAALGITTEMMDTYRDLGKYNFECGDYKAARAVLENYITFFSKPPPTAAEGEEDENPNTAPENDQTVGNSKIYYLEAVTLELLPVLWGKLAAEILVEDWEAARVALVAVQSGLESLVSQKEITSLQALQQRTWLLHWSLFVYWNNGGLLEHLVELMQSERYKQAITTNAPHLLRYLTAAVLLNKRRSGRHSSDNNRRWLKNLINVMQDCDYTDPIVDFVHSLCVKYDFDSAQLKLAECEKVLSTDFFLCKQTALFMEEARVFVFENYCRIHNKIHISTLGNQLHMSRDEAERWIVDLIRNSTDLVDAKMGGDDTVVMGGEESLESVYEHVLERTRELNVRSATLVQNLQSVLAETAKQEAKMAKAARGDD